MSNTDSDNPDEGRLSLELGIAEYIAQLSQVSDTPTEFDQSVDEIRIDEVDFATGAWMARLASVQGWMWLDEDLPLASPEAFLNTLTRCLGVDPETSAIEEADGQWRLSMAGMERLSARLQRATQLQDQFQDHLEADGGSQASATAGWRTAWEEEKLDEEGGGPVSAAASIWGINDFISKAVAGKLNLSPSYQRGDVWPTTDAQILIESVLRGIPLPSVIILKPPAPLAPYEVVDGKQRLTAILRFTGKHPDALKKVSEADALHEQGGKLLKLFKTDYPTFRKLWKNLHNEQLTASLERLYYFPFKLRTGSRPLQGELSQLQGKYYSQIKDRVIPIVDELVEVEELFETGATPYKIPLIIYNKATPRQIHEVFNLYNKQGKHLNAEEIRNAVYHNLDFMRALMVASGDNSHAEDIPEFLKSDWGDLKLIAEMLQDYKFGEVRYKRTKVLAWIVSMLVSDIRSDDGVPLRKTTALHINSMLDRIEGDPNDPLRKPAVMREVLLLVKTGMDAHSAVDEAWAPLFRDGKSGDRWQELQLVASILGVTLAAACLGDETADKLASKAPELYQKTGKGEKGLWRRPQSAKTKSQWDFIAYHALSVAEFLDVDLEEASAVLTDRLGVCSIPMLKASLPPGALSNRPADRP